MARAQAGTLTVWAHGVTTGRPVGMSGSQATPWGWLPYQCGTWNYFNNFSGWGWIPGTGCWNNWGGVNWYPGGGRLGNVPPRYHRLPRPGPVPIHPVQTASVHPLQARALIPVNRGPEATTLTPHLGEAPRTIEVTEGTAHLLPKTSNPQTLASGRPGMPTNGSPGYGRPTYGLSGAQPLGNTPVFRPTTPVAGSRPAQGNYGGAPASRSSFAPAPSSGASFHGSAPSAPAASAPAPSAPAPSAGAGHPR